MAIPNRDPSQTKYTDQNMGNSSFDEDFNVNAVENLVYNPVTDALDRMVQTPSLITKPFDYIGVNYPDTSTEVYTYKSGGASGTEVGVITVVYSDAVTKQIITSVTKA
jgi:hypothetical protein